MGPAQGWEFIIIYHLLLSFIQYTLKEIYQPCRRRVGPAQVPRVLVFFFSFFYLPCRRRVGPAQGPGVLVCPHSLVPLATALALLC